MIIEQSCRACASKTMRNYLMEQPGQPIEVYVRCAACGEFVSRYVLSEYYYHQAAYESFVRTRGAQMRESGRSVLEDFEELKQRSLQGYETLLSRLAERPEAGRQEAGEQPPGEAAAPGEA
ncbi:MAG: hypothetical protein ACF8R7_11025 [Phycisphaerales bacterium JB039]